MAYSRQGMHDKFPIRLVQVVEETVEMLRSTIPTTVDLIWRGPEDCLDLTILADATHIQEILLNLCTNAVHAMEEEGVLSIGLDRIILQQADIPLQYAVSPGLFARLSVEDNGGGMSAVVLEKIFDPFFTTKDISEGTGIGLSTVKGIVEQYNGLIKVRSTPGKGSLFEICFPLVNARPTERPEEKEKIAMGAGTILLVDDDEMLAKIVALMLTEAGYQVIVETSGLRALERIKTAPEDYNLVVTDQTMPKMTGKELTQELKNIRPELPVILFTGYSSKLSEEEVAQLGISAFFMKPVEMQHFLRTVSNILSPAKA